MLVANAACMLMGFAVFFVLMQLLRKEATAVPTFLFRF